MKNPCEGCFPDSEDGYPPECTGCPHQKQKWLREAKAFIDSMSLTEFEEFLIKCSKQGTISLGCRMRSVEI